jgi:transcriptional regulator GlxA family with amidase domain
MRTRNYPSVRVWPTQSLVMSRKAQHILTARGGSSRQDLALYLIARFMGLNGAIAVERGHMLPWHDFGQQPFASLVFSRQSKDAVIAQCQEWVAQNCLTPSPVAEMIGNSGLSQRTFEHRLAKPTGMKPL